MNAADTNVYVYALDADEPVKQAKGNMPALGTRSGNMALKRLRLAVWAVHRRTPKSLHLFSIYCTDSKYTVNRKNGIDERFFVGTLKDHGDESKTRPSPEGAA